jgi:hypothetical protein
MDCHVSPGDQASRKLYDRLRAYSTRDHEPGSPFSTLIERRTPAESLRRAEKSDAAQVSESSDRRSHRAS